MKALVSTRIKNASAVALVVISLISLIGLPGSATSATPTLTPERAAALRPQAAPITPPPGMRVDPGDFSQPAIVGDPVPTDPRDGRRQEHQTQKHLASSDGAAYPAGALEIINGYEESGGDDVVFGASDLQDRSRLQVTSTGVIFLSVGLNGVGFSSEFIEIYRSLDGGDTFGLVQTISSSGSDYDRLYDLDIVEGVNDRLFITYMHFNSGRGGFDLRVAWTNLATPTTGWQIRTVMDVAGVSFLGPDMANDVLAFDDYFLYVVCAGLDGNGDDLWFSRSTDYGETWAAPFRIESISVSGNLMFSMPKIEYGSGGELHLAYRYTERLQSTFDDAVRYKKGINYGAVVGDWEVGVWQITPTTDGIDQHPQSIMTDTATDKVVILYTSFSALDPMAIVSNSGGDTWSLTDLYAIPMLQGSQAVLDHAAGKVYVVGNVDGGGFPFDPAAWTEAPLSDLGLWSPPLHFGEFPQWFGGQPAIGLDPTRSPGLAMSYTALSISPDYQTAFDATWRDGDGYPNYESGFPLPISAAPAGPPTVANLDGGDFDEITWLDVNGLLHAVSRTGTELSGWPVSTGSPVTGTAVAVGDLNGDGVPALVVGDATGQLHAHSAETGLVLPGFPVQLGNNPVRAAIAPVAAPYPMSIVATSGQEVFLINYRGVILQTWDLGKDINTAPAIGDLDNDGSAEIVVTSIKHINGMSPGNPAIDFSILVTLSELKNPPTLVDLDLDGTREIVMSTSDGYLKAFESSGTFRWNYFLGVSADVSAVAAAHNFGLFTPELMVTSGLQAHLVDSNGNVLSGYPQSSSAVGGGTGLLTAPVANRIHNSSSSLIVGNDGGRVHAWSNIGTSPAGWPKDIGANIQFSAATGDIDNDGRNEVVYLTATDLVILDVSMPEHPAPDARWAQWGSDAGHSFAHGAANSSVVSAVEDEAASRFAFAPPNPNPSSGNTNFSFTLPADGQVELGVYDLRGRRVRNVLKRQFPLGPHTVQFDGRDDLGHRLANGIYFARLTVSGGARPFVETRKIAVLR